MTCRFQRRASRAIRGGFVTIGDMKLTGLLARPNQELPGTAGVGAREPAPADLDEVRLAASDANGDLCFEWISDSERYLPPTNAATFAVLDRASAGAFSGASGSTQDAAQACAVAATTADRIPVGELGAGDVLCVRTGEGRLSVLTIFEPVGPSPTQLRATATTYQY